MSHWFLKVVSISWLDPTSESFNPFNSDPLIPMPPLVQPQNLEDSPATDAEKQGQGDLVLEENGVNMIKLITLKRNLYGFNHNVKQNQ